MKKRYVVGLLLIAGGCSLQAQPRKELAETVLRYDAYVAQAMRDWRVPGLTVTVVKNGQVLLKKGYGVRQLGRPEPVTTQTLFAMASTTKAMTAACLGMLVDEGKLNWDDPVTNHLPDFQLYDPAVTRSLRVRDLLLHNTGLGNADVLWTAMQVPADEVLRRLRFLEPAYPLRAGFVYQNIMYLAAGKVIEHVSGQPWETFIRQRLFEPLGMTRTRALFREMTDANRARPHVLHNDTIRLVESRQEEASVDVVGPAGSVWSCADDLTAWMQCMLDSGRYNGKQLLKPATWAELVKPQTIVTDAQFYPTQQLTRPIWKTYALGWFQHDYRGHRINFHTGSLTGMIALHAQLPDQQLAVYVQGNLDHAELRHALMYRAFDVFGLPSAQPPRDWNADLLRLYGGIRQRATLARQKIDSTRIRNTSPSLPLSAYVGTYADSLVGRVVVSLQHNTLRFSANETLKGKLAHWHFDTFQLVYDDFWNDRDLLYFALDATGKPARLSWGGTDLMRLPDKPANGVAER